MLTRYNTLNTTKPLLKKKLYVAFIPLHSVILRFKNLPQSNLYKAAPCYITI